MKYYGAWFRCYINIIDDPKMAKLSPFQFKIWIFLCALCKEIDNKNAENEPTGLLTGTTLTSLSFRFREKKSKLSPVLAKFESLDMVYYKDKEIVLTNWKLRQYKSDDRTRYTKESYHRNIQKDIQLDIQEDIQLDRVEQKQNRTEKNRTEQNRETAVQLVTQIAKSKTVKYKQYKYSGNGQIQSIVLEYLKRRIGNGNQALKILDSHTAEYCLRKMIHFDYIMTTNKKPNKPEGYLIRSIQQKYDEPSGFLNWWEKTKDKLIEDDNIPDKIKTELNNISGVDEF